MRVLKDISLMYLTFILISPDLIYLVVSLKRLQETAKAESIKEEPCEQMHLEDTLSSIFQI